ncbi:MAG: hypothetical protein ACN2B6_00300 [Rickettsiales bacterium]
MKTKLEQLVDIALNDDMVSNTVTVANLARLECGDLSQIGSAIINGQKVVSACGLDSGLVFTASSDHYTIVKPTIMIGNVECVAPESEPPKVGSEYYTLSGSQLKVSKARWDGDNLDHLRLESGLVWLDKDDTKQATDAIKKLLTSASK